MKRDHLSMSRGGRSLPMCGSTMSVLVASLVGLSHRKQLGSCQLVGRSEPWVPSHSSGTHLSTESSKATAVSKPLAEANQSCHEFSRSTQSQMGLRLFSGLDIGHAIV